MQGLKQHRLYKTISQTSFSRESFCDIKTNGFYKSLEFEPGVVFLILDNLFTSLDDYQNSEYKCLIDGQVFYLSICNHMIKTFLVAVEPE